MTTYPYTAGPWYCVSGEVWTTPGGPLDGGVCIGLADRDEPRTAPCERDSNVRLMATAPEMLAALKRQAQGLLNLIEFDLIPASHFPDTRKEAEQLDSLIAKAEGRS